ncbi:VWA domain-containing protein [Legionella sp. CNM-4043-24]|uniref:VWA domain-containing protein n=1 Tax=Legionella sp. CNM-4043-24 TaxID=3421646 RepID=UPI00403B1E5E
MFELAMPWLLLLLFLPVLVWCLIPRAETILPAALKVPFYQDLSTLMGRDGQSDERSLRAWLLFFSWVFMVFAMAGPRWVGEPVPLAREGRNIMMVLDLSGSMELEDMILNGQPVSRLDVVKQAARAFVQARAGDRIGLILFGSQAYLQTPLTFDRGNVLQRLDDATVGLAGKTTSIGDALGLAVKRLQDVPPASRVIILLTDGANNSGVLAPMKAAELARDDAIKVYTIGLGAESDPRAMSNPLFDLNAVSELDEQTLRDIAEMTGGRYFRATDTGSLRAIYDTINQLEAVSRDQATLRPQKDYYAWPLACALVLLMLWFADRARLVPAQRSLR